ncbi:hypothetical protein BHM03_00003018 [Ensete ventricosum]|nr:hypothetical protein BHM03_00003018 [Ensete ventricosum]
MISAVTWVPKGASKISPVVAEPPSKDEIEEILKTGALRRSGDSEEDEQVDMDVDDLKDADEVAHALATAEALSKDQGDKGSHFQDIADGLRELDMDHYDDEDDGTNFLKMLCRNFIAVGSMEPAIEIWDLDSIDEVQPFLILGGVSKKKKKGKKFDNYFTTLQVQAVAWNQHSPEVLLSGSFDQSVVMVRDDYVSN